MKNFALYSAVSVHAHDAIGVCVSFSADYRHYLQYFRLRNLHILHAHTGVRLSNVCYVVSMHRINYK